MDNSMVGGRSMNCSGLVSGLLARSVRVASKQDKTELQRLDKQYATLVRHKPSSFPPAVLMVTVQKGPHKLASGLYSLCKEQHCKRPMWERDGGYTIVWSPPQSCWTIMDAQNGRCCCRSDPTADAAASKLPNTSSWPVDNADATHVPRGCGAFLIPSLDTPRHKADGPFSGPASPSSSGRTEQAALVTAQAAESEEARAVWRRSVTQLNGVFGLRLREGAPRTEVMDGANVVRQFLLGSGFRRVMQVKSLFATTRSMVRAARKLQSSFRKYLARRDKVLDTVYGEWARQDQEERQRLSKALRKTSQTSLKRGKDDMTRLSYLDSITAEERKASIVALYRRRSLRERGDSQAALAAVAAPSPTRPPSQQRVRGVSLPASPHVPPNPSPGGARRSVGFSGATFGEIERWFSVSPRLLEDAHATLRTLRAQWGQKRCAMLVEAGRSGSLGGNSSSSDGERRRSSGSRVSIDVGDGGGGDTSSGPGTPTSQSSENGPHSPQDPFGCGWKGFQAGRVEDSKEWTLRWLSYEPRLSNTIMSAIQSEESQTCDLRSNSRQKTGSFSRKGSVPARGSGASFATLSRVNSQAALLRRVNSQATLSPERMRRANSQAAVSPERMPRPPSSKRRSEPLQRR